MLFIDILLPSLHLAHIFIGNVMVAIEVEPCGLVVKIGTRLAFIEELQGLYVGDTESSGKNHRYGTNTVAHDNLLHHGRLGGGVKVILFHHTQNND